MGAHYIKEACTVLLYIFAKRAMQLSSTLCKVIDYLNVTPKARAQNVRIQSVALHRV